MIFVSLPSTNKRNRMKRLFKLLMIAAIAFLAGSVYASAQQQYSDIFEYIRGRVPGVQVGQAGPGQTPSIVIRGVGTNSEHTQPLFIVDGLQVDNIASIDPNNVYQIDIIKDGTSSIYGMQGANGVIMVTTKSAVHAQEMEAAAKKAAKQAKRESKNKNKAE